MGNQPQLYWLFETDDFADISLQTIWVTYQLHFVPLNWILHSFAIIIIGHHADIEQSTRSWDLHNKIVHHSTYTYPACHLHFRDKSPAEPLRDYYPLCEGFFFAIRSHTDLLKLIFLEFAPCIKPDFRTLFQKGSYITTLYKHKRCWPSFENLLWVLG